MPKGVFWKSVEGSPSTLIRGALSCNSGLIVWKNGRGRASAGRKWRIIDDPIFEVYLCRGEGDAEREYVVGTIEGMDAAECECGRVEKSNESRRRRGIVRPTPFPNIFSRKISRLSSDASELHSLHHVFAVTC